MIEQVQKPLEEILEYLKGKKRIVIVGYGGCATVFHTGGKEEVKEMADTLSEKGEEILAVVAPSLTQCAEGLLNGPVGDPKMESVRQILKEIVPGY